MNSVSSTDPYYPTPDDIYTSSHEDQVHRFVRIVYRLTPRAYVSKLLVLANVLVFLAMVASGVSYSMPSAHDALAWGASYAPWTMNDQWWRLFTCTFVHFGLLHIGLNMWVLWQLGPLAERLFGNIGFLLMYVICGIAGSVASLYWSPITVSAGASGAVFGVAGAVLSFTLLQKKSIPMVAFSGIKSSMVAFVGYNMLFGFAINAARPGGISIGMAAHAGGCVAGLICGMLLSQPVELAAGRRRWLHNLAMLAVGCLLIGAAIRLLPPAPDDLLGAVDRLNAVNHTCLTQFNKLGEALNARQIDPRTFDSDLNRQVISPWHELQQQFLQLKNLPAEQRPQVTQIQEYLRVREESFQLAAEAVRSNSAEKMREFEAKMADAEKLNRAMSSGAK